MAYLQLSQAVMRQQGSHHLHRDPEPAVFGFFRWNHRGTTKIGEGRNAVKTKTFNLEKTVSMKYFVCRFGQYV